VSNLLDRYEELVALRLAHNVSLQKRLEEQGRAIVDIDSLQPTVGQEILWVVRECLSGEVLVARSLLSGTSEDLKPLLKRGGGRPAGARRGRHLGRAARHPQGRG
jgi:hypothetical protein